MTTDQRHALKTDAREFARARGRATAGDYASLAMVPGTGSAYSLPGDPIATRYAVPGGRAAARAEAGLPALYEGEDDQDFEEVQDDQDDQDFEEVQDFEAVQDEE